MPQRLTPLEVSLLALDTAHTPGQVGAVAVLEPGDHEAADALLDALSDTIAARVPYAPRYRQRVLSVPGRLAGPVWVDDEDFDLSFHVRRVALPRPGTDDQLRELVAQVLARRLDRSRPLWEIHLVEGLEGGRVALVEKAHLALVDGGDTVDLTQVLLDSDPDAAELGGSREWHPALEPSPADLVVGALWESAQDPANAVDNLRGLVAGALGVAVAVGEVVGGTLGSGLGDLAGDALRGGRPPTGSPLAGTVSQQRRYATLRVPLADLRAVHAAHGHTVNDVVLAMIAGGLRAWLLTRGERLGRRPVSALVPMSVLEDDLGTSSLGVQVAPHVQDLPVGEPNALMRLHQVAYGSKAHRDSGRAVDARTLTDIAGFAPATLQVLGVRVAAETVRRPHDLLVTNVPGPQVPLYAAGSRMSASYPVVPLAAGHLLAIGVTSYDGEVFLGLTADRDAIADLDVLVQCLDDALYELVETTDRVGRRAPTRAATPAARRAAASKAAARAEAARRTAANRRRAVRDLAAKAASAARGPQPEEAAAEPSTTAPVKQAPAEKTAAKKSAATKTTATKTTAKKTTAKKTTAKKTTPSKDGTT